MKFRCEREILADALTTAGRAATNRSGTLPVLSGVRLDVADGRLTVTGTDLELTIRLSVPVHVDKEGSAVVPARLVGDIVKALPPGAVDVTVTDDEMSISAGRSQFSVRPLSLSDYPAQVETDAAPVTLSSQQVGDALRQVVRAASTDDARAVLTGVLMASEDDGLKMVATDSYRLAVRDLPQSSMLAAGQKVLVPGRALAELQRVLVRRCRTLGAARCARGGVRGRRHAALDAIDRGRVPELPQPAAVVVPEPVDGRAARRCSRRCAGSRSSPRTRRRCGSRSAATRCG